MLRLCLRLGKRVPDGHAELTSVIEYVAGVGAAFDVVDSNGWGVEALALE